MSFTCTKAHDVSFMSKIQNCTACLLKLLQPYLKLGRARLGSPLKEVVGRWLGLGS